MKTFDLYPIVNGCSIESPFVGTSEQCAEYAKMNGIIDYIIIEN